MTKKLTFSRNSLSGMSHLTLEISTPVIRFELGKRRNSLSGMSHLTHSKKEGRSASEVIRGRNSLSGMSHLTLIPFTEDELLADNLGRNSLSGMSHLTLGSGFRKKANKPAESQFPVGNESSHTRLQDMDIEELKALAKVAIPCRE